METHNSESQLTQSQFDGLCTLENDSNLSYCSLDEESSSIPTTFDRLNSPLSPKFEWLSSSPDKQQLNAKNNTANPSSSPPMYTENENNFSQQLLKENFLSSRHVTSVVPSVDLYLLKRPKMSTAEEKSVTKVPTQLSKGESNNPFSTAPNRPVLTSPSVKKLLISMAEKKVMKRKNKKSFKSSIKTKRISPVYLTQTLKREIQLYFKKSHRANRKLT